MGILDFLFRRHKLTDKQIRQFYKRLRGRLEDLGLSRAELRSALQTLTARMLEAAARGLSPKKALRFVVLGLDVGRLLVEKEDRLTGGAQGSPSLRRIRIFNGSDRRAVGFEIIRVQPPPIDPIVAPPPPPPWPPILMPAESRTSDSPPDPVYKSAATSLQVKMKLEDVSGAQPPPPDVDVDLTVAIGDDLQPPGLNTVGHQIEEYWVFVANDDLNPGTHYVVSVLAVHRPDENYDEEWGTSAQEATFS